MASELNPWTRRSRTTVYDNPWLTVFHDEVVRPDGRDGIYGVVHPKTSAVGVLALDDQDRVLLVGQYRYTLDRYSWELPEGGVAHGEDPLKGAKRELAEETGVRASTWREALRFSLSNSVTDETGVLYVATDVRAGEPDPDGTEELRTAWVRFDDAVAQVLRGELFDSITQIGLLLLAAERARGRSGA